MKTTYNLPAYLCGKTITNNANVDVMNPWDNSLTGTAARVQLTQVDQAIENTLAHAAQEANALTRYQRHEILMRAGELLTERADEFAHLICREAGLCMRETRYEVGRVLDVFKFAAIEALRDDGQTFSCDVTPHGKSRRIHTMREPAGLILAITPFNHPLNQVAHKVAPAIAAGAPMLLKPSEKTPLSAIRLVELLYDAGLPQWMLSVFVGEIDEVVEPLICDERIKLVTFTGGTTVGKRIAAIAGYKKVCLELGGNAPLIIHHDADLELAVKLACEGNFRNSGQRCTAVKRTLVHDSIYDEFVERFVDLARDYTPGDPADEQTVVGTVIDESAAITLEKRIRIATDEGAKVLLGGERHGALIHPTVLRDVPRTTEMVIQESFGPLAPVIAVKDIDDAIDYANSSSFGLSSGVVTKDIETAMKCVKRLKTGTVNINDVPGFRIECSPFGGIKDSGLGIKEGVIEAMKMMTNVKTYSLPW